MSKNSCQPSHSSAELLTDLRIVATAADDYNMVRRPIIISAAQLLDGVHVAVELFERIIMAACRVETALCQESRALWHG